jgi:hypothetical protein
MYARPLESSSSGLLMHCRSACYDEGALIDTVFGRAVNLRLCSVCGSPCRLHRVNGFGFDSVCMIHPFAFYVGLRS